MREIHGGISNVETGDSANTKKKDAPIFRRHVRQCRAMARDQGFGSLDMAGN